MRTIAYGVTAATLLCLMFLSWRALSNRTSSAKGEYAYILDDPEPYQPRCSHSRPIVLSIEADGSTKVNSDAIPDAFFLNEMKAIYSHRCERSLFLRADPEVPYAAVIEKIGRLHMNIKYLHIALITGSEQLEGCGPTIRIGKGLYLPDCDNPQGKPRRPELPQ